MRSQGIIAVLFSAFVLTTLSSTSTVAAPAKRCVDLFGEIESEVSAQAQYNKDFGPGVFVQKINNTEFRIEPPPIVVTSARTAQRKLSELAGKQVDERFTIVFHGISEREVLSFKAMLQRDERLQGDDRLSAILLETEARESDGQRGYEKIRHSATTVRNTLLRRYNWSEATVTLEKPVEKGPREIYKLTIAREKESESFLLHLRLKSFNFVKNRTHSIISLLGSNQLANATPEQMAHTVVSELRISDKGITTGTLKVMAADFVIAHNP